MDFPARPLSSTVRSPGLMEALGMEGLGVESDMAALAGVESHGTIVTAPGAECDFVSRFFAPRFGIPEDLVTSSAHCVLVPYWARKLNKTVLHARQISKRGGEFFCQGCDDRVLIAGKTVVYPEGAIVI